METHCLETHCAERKDYCDKRLDDLRRLMCNQFTAMDKAIFVARSEMDKGIILARSEMEKDVTLARQEMGRWMEDHNQFKKQLKEQTANFLDTRAYVADYKLVGKEIETLREWKSRTEGERSKTILVSLVAVAISLISAAFLIIQGVR